MQLLRHSDAIEVSRATGISLSTVRSILNGERNTNYENANKIARALNIDLVDLQSRIIFTRRDRLSRKSVSDRMRALPLLVQYTSAPEFVSSTFQAA